MEEEADQAFKRITSSKVRVEAPKEVPREGRHNVALPASRRAIVVTATVAIDNRSGSSIAAGGKFEQVGIAGDGVVMPALVPAAPPAVP
jgi:hypothetical protein